eukprot:163910_1
MATAYRYNLVYSVYSLILFTCILLLSLFFGYIQCRHRNRSTFPLKHTQILSNISWFTIIVSIPFYLDIAFHMTHIITIFSCRIGVVSGIIVLALHKTSMYLFIAIHARAEILQSLRSLQCNSSRRSFNISLSLILIYILIIIFTISKIVLHPHDTVLITHGLCDSTSTLQLLISQFAADLIIRVHCMTVLLLRVRVLMNSERQNMNERRDIRIKKLLVYSSIPMLSSVLVYPSGIASKTMYPDSNTIWAFKMDIFVDVCCIVVMHAAHRSAARVHSDNDTSHDTESISQSMAIIPQLVKDVSDRSIHDKLEWD